MTIQRQEFYSVESIYSEIKEKIDLLKLLDEKVDYISFVPDGEPTLDKNLGKHLIKLKEIGIKTAVITNSSLLWDETVRADLMNADWVSIKIDAVNKDIWKKIDRPYGSLTIEQHIKGIKKFAEQYSGTLVTETMLVKGINDGKESVNEISELIKEINPDTAYILVPTRPPAELYVCKPTIETIRDAYNNFFSKNIYCECITENEEDTFFFSDDIESDILSISSVHPIRKDVIEKLLKRKNLNDNVIEKLKAEDKLSEYTYADTIFYKKRF